MKKVLKPRGLFESMLAKEPKDSFLVILRANQKMENKMKIILAN